MTISENQKATLKALGNRLKDKRLLRNDTQSAAAARIGICLATYRKMEDGRPSTPIGNWIVALTHYAQLSTIDTLFPISLFEQNALEESAPLPKKRQRVRRKT